LWRSRAHREASTDLKPGKDIFELRGIDRRNGCMVMVRPDRYLAPMLPLDAHRELASFFAGIRTGKGAGKGRRTGKCEFRGMWLVVPDVALMSTYYRG
jgi:hypothetical protein